MVGVRKIIMSAVHHTLTLCTVSGTRPRCLYKPRETQNHHLSCQMTEVGWRRVWTKPIVLKLRDNCEILSLPIAHSIGWKSKKLKNRLNKNNRKGKEKDNIVQFFKLSKMRKSGITPRPTVSSSAIPKDDYLAEYLWKNLVSLISGSNYSTTNI